MHHKLARWVNRWQWVILGMLLMGRTLIAAEPPPRTAWKMGPAEGVYYEGDLERAIDQNGQVFKRLTIHPILTGLPFSTSFQKTLVTWSAYNHGGCQVDYPKGLVGKIIPAAGQLYRVAGSVRPGGYGLTLADSKSLPKGVVPSLTSYTIPLDGYGQLRGIPFQVDEIMKGADGKMASARIRLLERASGFEWEDKPDPITIDEGGFLRIGPRAFPVRNIVPADREQRLIGWIELNPAPTVPDVPIPPWPPKKPERQIRFAGTPGHRRNYETWPAAGSWFIHTPWVGEATADDPLDLTIRYPELKTGQILPVLGHLYEVLPPEQYTTVSTSLRLADRNDLPTGVALSTGCFAVPLNGYARLYDRWFHVAGIAKNGNQPPTARIEVYGEASWTVVRHQPTGQHVAREGKLLQIGQYQFRVLNIVPADRQHHVAGWIEINPVPFKSDSMK